MRKLIEDDSRFTVREDGADLVLVLTPEWAKEVRERAMLQALEVLRRRIDDPQTGIPESVITRQGGDRILIEIPGVDRVPDIFRKTGYLEFKIVKDAAPSEELLRAKHKDGLPPGTEIAVEKERKTDRVITRLPGAGRRRHQRRLPDRRAGAVRQPRQRVAGELHLVGRGRADLRRADREDTSGSRWRSSSTTRSTAPR